MDLHKWKVTFTVDWNYPDNPVWAFIEAPNRDTAVAGMRAVLSQTYLEPEDSFTWVSTEEASEDDLLGLKECVFQEYEGRVWL